MDELKRAQSAQSGPGPNGTYINNKEDEHFFILPEYQSFKHVFKALDPEIFKNMQSTKEDQMNALKEAAEYMYTSFM